MITYKKLTTEETKQYYDTYLTVTFPADEVKPFQTLENLMRQDRYRCYGFYEEEKLTGYAFLCEDQSHTVSLLDYYEIMELKRGQGYGQKILCLLEEIYKDYEYVILESEDPDFPRDERDLAIRENRIRFYEKCGLLFSGVKVEVFDVHYRVLMMVCRKKPTVEEVRKKIIEIYQSMIREPYFSEKVHLD